MFHKKFIYKLRFYIFFFLYILFFFQFSTKLIYAKIYNVSDLEISGPYEIDFNKQNIIDTAFNTAFRELITKITLSTDHVKFNNTNLNIIRSLVDSFTIIDEKFINNYYFATFNVDFDKNKVLKYLEKKNVFPSIPKEKKILLIPILIDIENQEVSLFSENPFYVDWNKNNYKNHLLKYILPNEDLDDLRIISSEINNIEDYDFKKIIKKYDLNDYIIIILFKNRNNFKILSKINLNNNEIILNSFFPDIKFQNEISINKVIYELKTEYEDQWKKINQVNTSIKLPLTLSIDTKNYQLIEEFENKISSLDLVSNFYIDNFTSEITIYKIIYNSTPDKFISEIRNIGLKLDTSFKIWRIK